MSDDLLSAITEAEATIEARKKERAANQLDFRSPLALETIADELTLLRAEVKTLRYFCAKAQLRPYSQ